MLPDLANAGLALSTGLFCAAGVRCAQEVNAWWRRKREAADAWQASLASFDAAVAALPNATPPESELPLAWRGFRRFVIAGVQPEADDVASFLLQPEDGRPLPTYRAGQYVTLRVSTPTTPRPLVRCYSLSDAPATTHYRITVKRVGQMSSLLHTQGVVGSTLELQAPRGEFYLDTEDPRPALFIAGGIGITPLLSMMKVLLAKRPQHAVTLFYGVRHGADHAFREELLNLAKEHPNVQYVPCYSQPRTHDTRGVDFVAARRIDLALVRTLVPSPNLPVYLCGPASLMETLVPALRDWGCAAEDLRYEAFGPATVRTLCEPSQESCSKAEVTFTRGAQRITWDGTSRSLLEMAERHGIAIESGCRSGKCGLCAVKLLAGKVQYTTPPAASLTSEQCLTCITTPAEDVVLDA
jgi:ferredoxin-NADP reductase